MIDLTPYHANRPLWTKGLLFIKLRWVAFGGSLAILILGAITGYLDDLGTVSAAIMASILGGSNILFHLAHAHLHGRGPDSRRVRLYTLVFALQILADYSVVTLLIHTTGFTQVNLAFLYLPHVILTGMVCERHRISLAATFLSLGLVYWLLFTHADDFSSSHIGSTGSGLVVHGALVAAAFDTLLFVFVFFITNIIIKDMVKRRNDLLEINRQLTKMDREKQSYTLRATHELKAPFAAIQSYTEVILGGYLGELDPRLRDVMEKIRARSESLSTMIKHIIQLSNLRTTLFRSEDLRPVDLLDVIGECVERHADLARAKGIDLEISHTGYTATITHVIPNLFEILLDNLLSNAIQYSLADSTVLVSIRREGGGLAISVKDRGIGIPAEDMDNVFEEHYRCENAQEVNPQGNGMGLAIVKEAVRLHGGSIRVAGEEGKGTEFLVTVPVTGAPQEDLVL